jgi:DNA polymerase (family 10)
VYEVLGLPYIEPELREGRGELQAAIAGELPVLVTEADLKGDLHAHTTLSDGRSSLADMAKAAQQYGYEYLAVTDHSASHGFGNDVQADELLRQVERVRTLNEELDGFTVLAGTEVNINTDGSLDYPDDVLEELDWIVASAHTSFRMGEEKMTSRIMAAMDHPLVDVIGHPTGRKILRREPYAVNVERLVAHAAETGTFLEINANPDRRDLNDVHARLAAEAGVPIVINSDAHSRRTLRVIRYGVATARRAWLTKKHVANTRSWPQLDSLRKRGGRKAATSRRR